MAQAIISLRQVSKNYGKVQALDRFSLDLQPGKVSALLGPNGAGKTTSIALMMGLARPTSGTVMVFGEPAANRRNRHRIGAMLQISGLPEALKVKELLNLFRSYYPAPLAHDAAVELCGLSGLLPRRFGQLSGGEKQRVLFALAVCGNPQLLFLDEPTVGMDVGLRNLFWNAVRQLAGEGCAMVLTTHYLEEADALADYVAVIDHGRLVAEGSPAQIKSLVPSGRVRCRTRLSAARVTQMAGVGHVAQEGSLLSIATTEPENLVRELLQADPALSELEVGKADLAQAFLHLTDRESQPEAA